MKGHLGHIDNVAQSSISLLIFCLPSIDYYLREGSKSSTKSGICLSLILVP